VLRRLLSCVRKNPDITILPTLTRPLPEDGLAFVPLTRPRLTRLVAIVTRNGETLIPAAKRLETLLAEPLRAFALSRGAELTNAKTTLR